MNCPIVDPSHGLQSFRNRLPQRGSPTGSQALSANLLRHALSTGPQVLPGACSSAGFPRGHRFLQASTCSSTGSLPRATGGDLLHRGLPWAAGGQPASPWSSPQGCRGKTSAPVPGSPPPPPSSLTLVSAGLFLSHCLTPLCRLLFHHRFFPLLNYVITEALPPSLMGWALASSGSVLEPAGTGSVGHGRSFLKLLTEATPVAPLLPKPCHTNQHRIATKLMWRGLDLVL